MQGTFSEANFVPCVPTRVDFLYSHKRYCEKATWPWGKGYRSIVSFALSLESDWPQSWKAWTFLAAVASALLALGEEGKKKNPSTDSAPTMALVHMQGCQIHQAIFSFSAT